MNNKNIFFDRGSVYKGLYLEDLADLQYLLRIDKQYNKNPVILKIHKENNSQYMLQMRKLPDRACLAKNLHKKEKITISFAKELALIHKKLPQIKKSPNFLFNKITSDLKICKQFLFKKYIRSIYDRACNLVETNKKLLKKRSIKVKELHGDLMLDHIFFEGQTFSIIDPCHKLKFLIDDTSRDLAFYIYDLLLLKKVNLAKSFLKQYIYYSKDDKIPAITEIQFYKLILLRYFIYSGGF